MPIVVTDRISLVFFQGHVILKGWATGDASWRKRPLVRVVGVGNRGRKKNPLLYRPRGHSEQWESGGTR